MLLDFLYYIFIFPIEWGIDIIYFLAYKITGSYGWAVFMLSLCVNTIILPLYNYAEKLQNKERAKQLILKPFVDIIKKHYKGTKRFMLTAAYYRQMKYNPISGLKTLIGFAIQVPFFIAAFNYLENLDEIKEVSFFLIKDLSKPDGLFILGETTINLLPIIMTIVNLISLATYSKFMLKKEINQGVFIAFLFLLLLYNSASILVIYWTLNNVYSLIKNYYYSVVNTPLENKKTYPNSFMSFLLKNKIDVIFWLLSILLYFTSILLLKERYMSAYLTTIWSVGFIAMYFLFRSISKIKLVKSKILKGVIYFFILFSIIIALDRLIVIEKVRIFRHAPSQELLIVFSYLIIVLINISNWLKKVNSFVYSPSNKTQNVSIFISLGIINSIIFILGPILFYASDTSISDNKFIIIKKFIPYFISIQALTFIAFVFIKPSIKKYITFLFKYLSFVIVLYFFVFIKDIGTIHHFVIQSDVKFLSLRNPIFQIYDILIYLITLVILIKFYNIRWFKEVLSISVILFVSIFGLSIYEFYKIENKQTIAVNLKGKGNVPKYHKQLASLSNKHKNVLHIVLYGFTAGHLPEIFSIDTTLTKKLNGFVWYKNTLATSMTTIGSEPSLHGGKKLAPLEVNRVNDTRFTLEEKIAKGYNYLLDTIKNNSNFDYVLSSVDLVTCKQILLAVNNPEKIKLCLDYGFEKDYVNKTKLYDNNSDIKLLSFISVFRLLPFTFKRKLYDFGKWNGYNTGESIYQEVEKNFSFLETFTNDFVVDSTSKKGTFIYYKSMLSHSPYGIDTSYCKIVEKNELNLYFKKDNISQYRAQLYTEKCILNKLTRLFKRLKEKNIYDNTKIIISSDHSGEYNSMMYSKLESLSKKIKAHALFLYKDFNAKNDMQIDTKLVSTSDIVDISLVGKKVTHNVKYYLEVTSHIFNQNKSTFNIEKIYRVKNSMFKKENWAEISFEEYLKENKNK